MGSSSDFNVESVGITKAALGVEAIADTRGLTVAAVLGNVAVNKESLNSYKSIRIPDLSASGRTEATEISFSARRGQQGVRRDDRPTRDDRSTRLQDGDCLPTAAAPTPTESGDIDVMLSALKAQEEWEEKVDDSTIGSGNGEVVGLPTIRYEAPLLRRQGAMSDLWQHQAAFRTNQRSMKSIFEEFSGSLELPKNDGKSKAEINDIFTFSCVGYKHLKNGLPSEDRIAIHQAVTPTIDEATKKELEIDSIDSTPFAMFAVFDGHGGSACAEFLTESVSTVLAHSPVLYDEDLAPFERRACATADSFTELEKVHNEWARKSKDMSGSTAILSTFQDGVLVMAGVGDSAGLYVDHEGNKHSLCPQHSTKNPREEARVLSMGGTIINGRVNNCLIPTRTIGDLDCKQALGDIVSPHPEITLAAIYAPPDDGKDHNEPFLVLASDGLWDVLSDDQVTSIVQRSLRKLRSKSAKKAAKQEKVRNGNGRFNMGRKKKTSAAAVIDSSRPTNSTGKSGAASLDECISSRPSGGSGGLLDRFFESGGRADAGGGKYLDLSMSKKGLDASVRGGNGAGRRVPSAGLDESRYAGLQATVPNQQLTEVAEDANGRQPFQVVLTRTSATTGVRTAGTANDNPARHLVHEATYANSMDDISVVVVTFKAGNDKTKPGSRSRERRGSHSINCS